MEIPLIQFYFIGGPIIGIIILFGILEFFYSLTLFVNDEKQKHPFLYKFLRKLNFIDEDKEVGTIYSLFILISLSCLIPYIGLLITAIIITFLIALCLRTVRRSHKKNIQD
jgi:hypothetical protein